MADIEEIGEQLRDRVRSQDVDYLEVHLEEAETNNIAFRGRNLESVNKSASAGGNVRALHRGGWGFASFNSLDDIPSRMEAAIRQARFVGNEESLLGKTAPVVDFVRLEQGRNPLAIPLAEKKELLEGYNEIIWSTPGIQTSVIGYGDGRKKTVFLNSSGSFIIQERADVTLRVSAVASDGTEVEQVGVSLGSLGDFNAIRDLDDRVRQLSQKAVELLTAPQVKGGEHTVILDPVLAGVFVHEAFGHLSESDFVYENDQLRQIMTLGKEFGSRELNIVDSATVPNLRGSYRYDDEGTLATPTHLIREGKLMGRLHSRETAARMGEKPTGNGRCINYRFPPIVRMTNTYIEPQDATLEEMMSEVKEGVYVKNWYGGTTSMEMFTFSAGEAYMIRDGKVAETLRPVVLTGNVFTTLKNIDAIGNDLDMNQGGGCGKNGQMPLPVSNGSPHIRIRRCLIGGA